MRKSKNITTERLFEITADGFAETHAKIDKVDHKVDRGFEVMLGELKKIQEGQRSILSAVEALMDHKMEEFSRRIARIEKKVGI